MWPVENGYFTARYWVTDYWVEAIEPDRAIGTVSSFGSVGVVYAPGDLQRLEE